MAYKSKYIDSVGILRDYNGHGLKLTTLNFVKQDKFKDEPKKFTPKGEGGNESKLENNISRTKSTIHEIARCNDWKWFVTLTVDATKYDRNDLDKIRKDFTQMIRNYKRKTNFNIEYLLIPEHHQDGCWHLHGLINGIPKKELHAFQENEHLPYRILNRISKGTPVYTWKMYEKKFGYATFEEIKKPEAVCKYITKYITKDTMTTIKELNAHAFFASKGLKRSQVIKKDILSKAVRFPDYENEYCSIKWFKNPLDALSHFEEVHA